MTSHTALGQGDEFDRIRRVVGALGDRARSIGDDGAILDIPAGQKLIVSTDISVENVHFRRAWLSPQEIGFRATAAALSDLAAMGAMPIGVLLAIALPDSDAPMLEQIGIGAGEAVAACGTFIVGGDLSSAKVMSITVTVIGSAARPLGRNSAVPGDHLYITGQIGGSGQALSAFLRDAEPATAAREKFARPHPRIQEALWLAAHGATSCIDISDGIAGDLGHLAAASGVDIIVDAERIPLFPGSSLETALASGEEYELCVTAGGKLDSDEFARRFGIPLTGIGRIERSESPSVIFQHSGSAMQVPRSYSHFTK